VDTSVVFSGDLPAATLSDRVHRGQLVRLGVGVYTSDVTSSPAAVVTREWHTIFGRMFPSAVITDRSVLTGGPVEGVLYLAHDGRGREARLPGMPDTPTCRSSKRTFLISLKVLSSNWVRPLP
jgi:hypothetical protein